MYILNSTSRQLFLRQARISMCRYTANGFFVGNNKGKNIIVVCYLD